MNYSPPGSSVLRILQARILEWVARALLQGVFPTQGSNQCLFVFCIAGGFFTTNATWETPVEYDSGMKKNKTVPFAATWMDLEINTLSEVSQKEKDKYHMISLTCGI